MHWASEALVEVLARLTGQQAAGVVRIVEAELEGRSLASLLDCPDQICTSTTYYGSGKRRGWRDRPNFVEALRLARRDYRAWLLEHGTGEALLVLARTAPEAARALRHQVVGDAGAIAALIEMLGSEVDAERAVAARKLGECAVPEVVGPLRVALAEEGDATVRLAMIESLGRVASGLARNLEAAESVLDRAAIETAAKSALTVDAEDVDAAIERELARLAGGGADDVAGEVARAE